MGSSIKGVHTEGLGIMSKVDKCGLGGGSSYSRRPQTVPFVCDSLQLLDTHTAIQKWAKVTPFYVIVNLIPHSNFKVYMFYLLIYV